MKSRAGIPLEELENNAAYIQSWLKRLKEDKKFIFHASSQTQKAVDYILNEKVLEREDSKEHEKQIQEENSRLRSLSIVRGKKEKSMNLGFYNLENKYSGNFKY